MRRAHDRLAPIGVVLGRFSGDGAGPAVYFFFFDPVFFGGL